MTIKLLFLVIVIAASQEIEIASHTHSEADIATVHHGGGLDRCGGHNCSEKSKQKGLCSGYHYHQTPKC